MRKVWLIALNSLVRISRDRKALLMMLVFPLILIAILGNALKTMMNDGTINPFEVLVVNADTTQSPNFGQLLIDDVLGSDEAKKVINTTVATDLETARAQVADGKAVTLIHVPAGFSADVLSGKQPTMTLYSDPAQPTQADIVAQIVGQFTDSITSATLTGRVLGPEKMQQLGQQAVVLPAVKEVASGMKPVSSMQYYAAAMAAMFMIMTAFGRAKEIIQDRVEGTLDRILVSPTGRVTMVAGQVLGNMVVVLAQFIVLMFGTHLLYGVYWGEWIPALLLGFSFALAAAGIGTAATAILKEPKAADAAVGIVGNIFAMLSGGMAPLYIFTDGMRMVAKLTPNYWGLTGFLDQMSGMGISYVWTPVAVLAAIGLVTGALGSWRLASR